jgi:hypothetical protein
MMQLLVQNSPPAVIVTASPAFVDDTVQFCSVTLTDGDAVVFTLIASQAALELDDSK